MKYVQYFNKSQVFSLILKSLANGGVGRPGLGPGERVKDGGRGAEGGGLRMLESGRFRADFRDGSGETMGVAPFRAGACAPWL
jgi:hypothetical protein